MSVKNPLLLLLLMLLLLLRHLPHPFHSIPFPSDLVVNMLCVRGVSKFREARYEFPFFYVSGKAMGNPKVNKENMRDKKTKENKNQEGDGFLQKYICFIPVFSDPQYSEVELVRLWGLVLVRSAWIALLTSAA